MAGEYGISDEILSDGGDPRVPLLLLLDTSYSMNEQTVGNKTRIAELNEGLFDLCTALNADPVAKRRVEVMVVTFGGSVEVRGSGGFELSRNWTPPSLSANGSTPMGQAISTALDLVDQRRRELQRDGLPLYRPWLFMLTDGDPTDDVSNIPAEIAKFDQAKKVLFWCIATGDANTNILKSFTPEKKVLILQDNKWSDLFTWMSVVMKSTSNSTPGQQIEIPAWTVTT